MKGKVKWFNEDKGYGFITPEDGGKDVFVHHSDIVMEGVRKVADGDAVSFDIVDAEKGKKAVSVKKL
jgi:CspA family cold shock protein